MQHFQLENLNYTFKEIEFLKILAKYPDDGQRALDVMASGVEEYHITRLEKILQKFLEDGIWDFKKDKKGKYHSSFKLDLKEVIMNYPNPIPEKYKKDINPIEILEKLSHLNLDTSEIEYLNILIIKDLAS